MGVAERKGRAAGVAVSNFDPDRFIGVPAWIRLEPLLTEKRGNTVAVSGPRGAGKTWLMREACAWAEKQGGIGVWFPSPSQYEPLEFLAALSDVSATAYMEAYDNRPRRQGWTRTLNRQLLYMGFAGMAMLAAGAALVVAFFTDATFTEYLPVALGALLLAAGVAFCCEAAYKYVRNKFVGDARLRERAAELRRQVRYTLTLKEGREAGGEAGWHGVRAAVKRTSEQLLVERPATMSSLIHNFRSFAGLIPKTTHRHLVIAIDELDKLSDAKGAAKLLRDVKAVLDIDKVHVLVSISDEASRQLSLGTVRGRNEFNSSFDMVLRVEAVAPAKGAELLALRLGGGDDSDASANEARKIDSSTSHALTALAGGIPRDLVRMAELALFQDETCSPEIAAFAVAQEEITSFLYETITSAQTDAGAPVTSDLDRLLIYGTLRSLDSKPEFSDFAAGVLDHWVLDGLSPRWRARYGEEWRRLIVRLAMCQVLRQPPNAAPEEARMLQQVTTAVASSSHLGLEVLLRFLLTPHPPRPTNNSPAREARLVVTGLSTPTEVMLVTDHARREGINPGLASADFQHLEELGVFEERGPGRYRLIDGAEVLSALLPKPAIGGEPPCYLARRR